MPIDMPGAAKAEPARRTIPNNAFFICLLLTPELKARRTPNWHLAYFERLTM
jgi:hypothetical protein